MTLPTITSDFRGFWLNWPDGERIGPYGSASEALRDLDVIEDRLSEFQASTALDVGRGSKRRRVATSRPGVQPIGRKAADR